MCYFLVHSLAITAWLQYEIAQCNILWRTLKTQQQIFLPLSKVWIISVRKNSAPGKLKFAFTACKESHVWQPGASGFCYGASDFCPSLAWRAGVCFLGIQITEGLYSILLIKKGLRLVEMTFGLVYANYSLPEWQAVKLTFFAPCLIWKIESVEIRVIL